MTLGLSINNMSILSSKIAKCSKIRQKMMDFPSNWPIIRRMIWYQAKEKRRKSSKTELLLIFFQFWLISRWFNINYTIYCRGKKSNLLFLWAVKNGYFWILHGTLHQIWIFVALRIMLTPSVEIDVLCEANIPLQLYNIPYAEDTHVSNITSAFPHTHTLSHSQQVLLLAAVHRACVHIWCPSFSHNTIRKWKTMDHKRGGNCTG